jgi:hypothetical protein
MDHTDDLPKLKPSRHYLAEMIFYGLSLKKIANIVGRCERYVKKLLREYDLPTPKEFKQILREMWQNRIAVLYMRLNGINSIASQTPFNWDQLTSILNDMGLLTDLHLGAHVMKMRLESGWQPLSPHLQQVLEGEMLGDGNLTVVNSVETSNQLPSDDDIINALDDLQWFFWVDLETESSKISEAISLFNKIRENLAYLHGVCFQMVMSHHATEWVDYIATQFREGGYYVNVFPDIWVDKNGVEHPRIFLQTESSLNLRREWLRWYNRRKGVPWNFSLTPTSLLHWFIGDGCFGFEITLSTDSFHLTDVMHLALELRHKVGVKARLFWRPPKYKFGTTEPLEPEEFAQLDPNRYWRIKVPIDHESRTRFFDYLNRAPGIEVARRVFPWKFSRDVQKQDCV